MADDPRKSGDLVARLRWLLDEFESLSETVENDRCTRQSERDEMEAERQLATRTVEEAIAAAKRAGLAPGTAGRPGVESLGD